MRRSVAFVALAVVFASTSARALIWPDVPERVERALASQDPIARRAAARELIEIGPARGAPLVLRALGDADTEVRLVAAQSAIRLHVTAASDAVTGWLGDRETRLRIAACEVTRAMPDPKAVPQLARALGDSDAAVRAAAADSLGSQASADAVPPLLGKLDDASPTVRVQIARALARLGDTRAVVPLVGKVQDSVPEVRQAVARALGDLGDARATQALLLQLRDNVGEVRIEALGALGRLRAPDAASAIAPLAIERNAPIRQAALQALGRIATPDAVHALIGTLGLGDDAGGGLERTPARDALVACGQTAIPELVKVLEKPTSIGVATSVAWVLGELHAHAQAPVLVAAARRGALPAAAALRALAGAGTSDAVPIVLEFTSDNSPIVRGEAIRAANALLDPARPDGRAVEPLAAALRDVRLSVPERAAVAGLLGRTGAPRAASVLAGLTTAKDPALRIAAIDALGTLGPAGADDALLEKLSDPDATARLHAAVALAEAGSARARDALLLKLEGAEELDRSVVLTALGGVLARAPSEPAVAKLARSVELAVGAERDALIEALGRAALPSAGRALVPLTRGDVDDRRSVATLLAARASTPDALALARTLLADTDAGVRAQAAWSLGAIGDASFVPALLALTKHAEMDPAIDAAAALGRIAARVHAPQSAAAALCPLVFDLRPYVRANALAGLALSGARCGDGAAERHALEGDASDAVRAAAALAVGRNAASPDDRRALDRCMAGDRSGAVGRRCRTPPALPKGTHAVAVYVVADASASPRPRSAYAIELADGLLHVGTSDRRGAAFDPAAPDGDLTLRMPSALATK